jgi:hypothetical protein
MDWRTWCDVEGITYLAEALPFATIEINKRRIQIRSRLDGRVHAIGSHVRGGLEGDVQADFVVCDYGRAGDV